MISIELTTMQKVQVAIVALVLIGAGYLIFKGTRPVPDTNVASWVERKVQARNPAQPVSAANPLDPAKTAITTIFACFDGRLEITEYPSASNVHALFTFTPDARRKTFTVFQDLLMSIEDMSDSYKRGLSYAAYRVVVQEPSVGLLNYAGLTPDQRKVEKAARETMINSAALVDNGAQTGIFQPDAYKRVMAAMSVYKAAPGDPSKDNADGRAKAALAHKVVDLAVKYIGLIEQEKGVAIGKYVAAVDGMLTPDQRVKVQKAADKLTIRSARPRKPKVAALAGV
jgi:hypothetical protein